MKIKDIKDNSLRNLAIKRSDSVISNIMECNLFSAFDWDATPEGFDFWSDVNDGLITTYIGNTYKKDYSNAIAWLIVILVACASIYLFTIYQKL